MIDIIKIEHKDLPINIRKNVENKKSFEYYQVKEEDLFLGCFISYDNDDEYTEYYNNTRIVLKLKTNPIDYRNRSLNNI